MSSLELALGFKAQLRHHVDEHRAWQRAIDSAGRLYREFDPAVRQELDSLLKKTGLLKEELVRLTVQAGSSAVCRECGGECCRFGKFHVSVLDLLAWLSSGRKPIEPRFGQGELCPYGDTRGCQLDAGSRPFTCVIFNCEAVLGQLDPAAQQQVAALEDALRQEIARAEELAGMRLERPALLVAED